MIKKTLNILNPKTPSMLVFFVTAACNARCKMCFYETGVAENELSLEEIEKISSSMGHLHWLLLSGGEPFLRKDLPDLCNSFARNNSLSYLQIPTNGWNAERITTMSEEILKNNKGLSNFVVSVSVDHIGEKHDEIRGVVGLYEKLLKTASSLKKLKEKDGRFGLAVNLTYSGYNYKEIDYIYDTIAKEISPDTISLTLTRGTPKDKEALDFTIENYESLFSRINKAENYGYYSPVKKILAKGKDYYKQRIVLNSLNGLYTLPCTAGRHVGVLSEKGDIYVCELRDDKLGNIRDYNYDFSKAWKSEKIVRARKNIAKTKCQCTYECVIGPNVLFNPVFLFKSVVRGIFS